VLAPFAVARDVDGRARVELLDRLLARGARGAPAPDHVEVGHGVQRGGTGGTGRGTPRQRAQRSMRAVVHAHVGTQASVVHPCGEASCESFAVTLGPERCLRSLTTTSETPRSGGIFKGGNKGGKRAL
jgi:hypothetical protein